VWGSILPLRAPESYLWTFHLEFLRMRLTRGAQDSHRGHLPRFVCKQLRHGPLQEPLWFLGCRAEVARQILLCPARHRTSLRVMSGAAGFMKTAKPCKPCGVANVRKRQRRGRVGSLVGGGQRDRCPPGARDDVSGQIAAAEFAPGAESLEVGLYAEAADPVGAFGVSKPRVHVAQITSRIAPQDARIIISSS